MRTPISTFALLLSIGLLAAACGAGGGAGGDPLQHGEYPVPHDPGPLPGPTPGPGGGTPPLGLAGGVLVTIDTDGEMWQWWVTNPTTASYLEQAWNGTFVGGFNGVLREGPGAADHNQPWSWHVDPEINGHVVIGFAPPGTGWPSKPSECERNLTVYISEGRRFAARPFTMVAFHDYR